MSEPGTLDSAAISAHAAIGEDPRDDSDRPLCVHSWHELPLCPHAACPDCGETADELILIARRESRLFVLKRLEVLALRLWPFIRFWGLCGASPEAISLMLEIGRLTGQCDAAVAPDALARARAEGRREQHAADSLWFDERIGKKMMRTAKEEMFAEFEAMVP